MGKKDFREAHGALQGERIDGMGKRMVGWRVWFGRRNRGQRLKIGMLESKVKEDELRSDQGVRGTVSKRCGVTEENPGIYLTVPEKTVQYSTLESESESE